MANNSKLVAYLATVVQLATTMYGQTLRRLREAQGKTQAGVARRAGLSPAQLARLETNQRGLYVVDFVRIAEALGEKPGNLLPNDLGEIGHLKPVIDRLALVPPDRLEKVSRIIESIVALAVESGSPQSDCEPAAATPGSSIRRRGR
jgi:transcriptional regulator with XRE-family HTH domain